MKPIILFNSLYYNKNNIIFDNENTLNDNGSLNNFYHLKKFLNKNNYEIYSSDYFDSLSNDKKNNNIFYLFSYGSLDKIDYFEKFKNIVFKNFYIIEPPIIYNRPYKKINDIQKLFERVYVYNLLNHEYHSYDHFNLFQHYRPYYFDKINKKYWNNNNRLNKCLMMNSNKSEFIYRLRNLNFYNSSNHSFRIDTIKSLGQHNFLDLYGHNWSSIFNLKSFGFKYFLNFFSIQNIYKGISFNKYLTMSKYDFNISISNTNLKSHIDEKLIDCFYTGTIPIFYGPDNISDMIPSNSTIFIRDFKNFTDLIKYLKNLSSKEKYTLKYNGKKFFDDGFVDIFYFHLINSFKEVLDIV